MSAGEYTGQLADDYGPWFDDKQQTDSDDSMYAGRGKFNSSGSDTIHTRSIGSSTMMKVDSWFRKRRTHGPVKKEKKPRVTQAQHNPREISRETHNDAPRELGGYDPVCKELCVERAETSSDDESYAGVGSRKDSESDSNSLSIGTSTHKKRKRGKERNPQPSRHRPSSQKLHRSSRRSSHQPSRPHSCHRPSLATSATTFMTCALPSTTRSCADTVANHIINSSNPSCTTSSPSNAECISATNTKQLSSECLQTMVQRSKATKLLVVLGFLLIIGALVDYDVQQRHGGVWQSSDTHFFLRSSGILAITREITHYIPIAVNKVFDLCDPLIIVVYKQLERLGILPFVRKHFWFLDFDFVISCLELGIYQAGRILSVLVGGVIDFLDGVVNVLDSFRLFLVWCRDYIL